MSGTASVNVRELAGWGLDSYAFRPPSAVPCGEDRVWQRPAYLQTSALIEAESRTHEAALRPHAARADLLLEMNGLDWSLGMVDLRHLLSFQRRLSFDSKAPGQPLPAAQDWPALIDFSFGPPRPIACTSHLDETRVLVLQSEDPNLQLRFSIGGAQPITLYGGSPFLEVAEFRGRWFLRDGYHRAYRLLTHGAFLLPAVVVRARTLGELGAVQPWFFSEEMLFSDRPPRVVDFLDDLLTLQYTRPPLLKTLHLTVEESFAPMISKENTHEHCNQAR